MKEQIQQLLVKWQKEADANRAKIDILKQAREILPPNVIDAPFSELLTEQTRLQMCRADLQELLFGCDEKPAFLRKIMD
jgi:hypothetical protein